MVIRAFGSEGFAARIREHHRLARLVADWIKADERFELLAPVTMGVVCFRARKITNGESLAEEKLDEERLNEFNRQLLERINRTGATYLTHTCLHERLALRIAVGNVLTTERHLAQVWQLICHQYANQYASY